MTLEVITVHLSGIAIILILHNAMVPLFMVVQEILMSNAIAITIIKIFMTFTFRRDIQMRFTWRTQLTDRASSAQP